MRRDLRALPKGHLHVHMVGAMRHGTLVELCERDGLEVPAVHGTGDFSVFAPTYAAASKVLATPADLGRLMLEIAEDAAADGAVWVEPGMYLGHHRDVIGPDELTLEILIDAAGAAEAATGVGVGLMVSADRTRAPADALAQAQLAARHAGRGVVSFGLANDESRFPPAPFAEAFAVAADAGLLRTPHAGEHAGPESVWSALDDLGAQRVQHGVTSVHDPALVERLARDEICLDVCPTSNVELAVVRSRAEHPLPELLAAGVPVSLGADDPLFFPAGLLDEYEHARNEMALRDDQLAAIAAASVRHSGAPDAVKRAAAAKIGEWLR